VTDRVRRANGADNDLDEIWTNIAIDSIAAADRLIDRLEAAEDRLGDFPELGRLRDDIAADLRSWPVGDYLILYRVDREGVLIVRVLHGARDLPAVLDD
jgi:toxin ParE1/3/4